MRNLLEAQVNRYLPSPVPWPQLFRPGRWTPRWSLTQHTHTDRKQNVSESFTAAKGQNAIRMALLPLLGLRSAYSLDRLDLTVRTTLDQPAQKSVSNFLDGLSHCQRGQRSRSESISAFWTRGNPQSVIYSVDVV